MRNSRMFVTLLIVSLALAVLVCGKAAVAQDQPGNAIKCVKREPAVEPPRPVLPSLRPIGGKGQEHVAAPKLKPVCPEGEVPVPVAPSKQYFIKGNPMLRSYAAPGPAQPLPGDFVNRNLLLPFDQVYWKRDGKTAVRPPAKRPHSSGDPCDGQSYYGSCFYYGTASEQVVADGGGMTLQVEDPTVTGGDGNHSIGEIAVMGTGSVGAGATLDDVEMGFSVSPSQWGDNAPHLFVYHWDDGNQTCYNSCNWNQQSNTYYPGMDLTPLVGKFVYIGWVQYRQAWWGWFNDQWLGYIDNSAFQTPFTKTAQIQWYGEVASNNGIPPLVQMGNGQFPSQTTAAGMTTLCYVNAKAWVCYYNDSQSTGASDTNYYDIQNHTSFGGVRYGGPGQ